MSGADCDVAVRLVYEEVWRCRDDSAAGFDCDVCGRVFGECPVGFCLWIYLVGATVFHAGGDVGVGCRVKFQVRPGGWRARAPIRILHNSYI